MYINRLNLDYRRSLIFGLFALLTRLITFGNPILYTDEEFYFAVGRAVSNGALPFVDIWDRKPIGLFLLYALPGSLSWERGILLYQGMALACVGGTALIIARLADVAGWARGGTLAGVAYLAWITIAGGQGGQSPVFYNLAISVAALLIARPDSPVRWHGALAMLLVGIAIQIKYTVAVEGVYFGLWLLLVEWRRERRPTAVIGWGLVLICIAILPTIAVTSFYAAIGALPAFAFANFQSILERNSDPSGVELLNLAKAAAILVPLIAMAAVAGKEKTERVVEPSSFLRGWLLAALLAFALLPPWSDHYTLPVMLPATVMAAGLLNRPRGRLIGFALIAVAVLVGQASLIIDRQRRGTPAEFAALVEAIGGGPGCLYVYSSSSMLYPATERCAVSPYVFPSHLTRNRENGAIGVDQMVELRRIFKQAPSVVVMAPPYYGERLDIRAAALALINKDYRLAFQTPLGRKHIMVYRRLFPNSPIGGGSRLSFSDRF